MVLRYSVTRRSRLSAEQIFRRIDNLTKLMENESEFEKVKMINGDENSGTASVIIHIFGRRIKGKMAFDIHDGKITARIDSDDIKILNFGYRIVDAGAGSETTQLVEFDTGNSLKNLLIKIFYSGKIRRHLAEEIVALVERKNADKKRDAERAGHTDKNK